MSQSRTWTTPGATITRAPSPRITNLTLLLALLITFATGIGAVANGSASGRWVVIGHGVAAMMVVLLIPWKSAVIRRGLRRARHQPLGVPAACTTRGHHHPRRPRLHHRTRALNRRSAWHVDPCRRRSGARPVGGLAGARPTHPPAQGRPVTPRPASHRHVTAAAAGVYVATASAARLTGLPGLDRRFTGSYEAGSFDPASMPRYIWLNDSIPTVDADRWRLTVIDGDGQYQLTLADLSAYHSRLRALLDCTSGWYAGQDWTGAPVSALLRDFGDAQSLFVHSVTGYWIRFPVDEVDRLLLATAVGGQPLIPGHGFPVRLVAPGRRGFWWVKWVDRIELQSTPPWWQPPFPLA